MATPVPPPKHLPEKLIKLWPSDLTPLNYPTWESLMQDLESKRHSHGRLGKTSPQWRKYLRNLEINLDDDDETKDRLVKHLGHFTHVAVRLSDSILQPKTPPLQERNRWQWDFGGVGYVCIPSDSPYYQARISFDSLPSQEPLLLAFTTTTESVTLTFRTSKQEMLSWKKKFPPRTLKEIYQERYGESFFYDSKH